MAGISDEHGEIFQQDISQMEKCRVENGVQIFLLTATGDIRKTTSGE